MSSQNGKEYVLLSLYSQSYQSCI